MCLPRRQLEAGEEREEKALMKHLQALAPVNFLPPPAWRDRSEIKVKVSSHCVSACVSACVTAFLVGCGGGDTGRAVVLRLALLPLSKEDQGSELTAGRPARAVAFVCLCGFLSEPPPACAQIRK